MMGSDHEAFLVKAGAALMTIQIKNPITKRSDHVQFTFLNHGSPNISNCGRSQDIQGKGVVASHFD